MLVDIQRFQPGCDVQDRQGVLLYIKQRSPLDIAIIRGVLHLKGITVREFIYGSYKEEDYITALRSARYMIVVSSHECALQEAMACGVPLLIWDVCAPSENSACGIRITSENELASAIDRMEQKWSSFRSRDFAIVTAGLSSATAGLSSGIYYSQIAQDAWVHSVLGDKKGPGFFVELGACDGIEYSNTLFFERQLGWKGVCIEPNTDYFVQLQKNRRCHVSNALISDVSGVEKMFAMAGMAGGILDTSVGPFTHGATTAINKKITTTLATVLDSVGAPSVIDYLSLDVEGHELAILSTFPFDRYQFRCVTVEHNAPHVGPAMQQQIRALLTANGYRFAKGNDDIQGWGHGPIDDFYIWMGREGGRALKTI